MEHTDTLNIFFQENNTQALHQHQEELLLPESVPYLERGDSSKYIQQFIAKQEKPCEFYSIPQVLQKKKSSSVSQEEEEFSISQRARFSHSSFHNFQKHLTVCLKHSIQIQLPQTDSSDYHEAAVRLWKFFKVSSITTKKVLHFLLGESNEHKITDAVLKQFGLFKIYEQYGQKTMRQARNFLTIETLRQMKDGKISQYMESKQLKGKQRFIKYLQIFKQELQAGYLKKRLPKEKVLQLQRCQ